MKVSAQFIVLFTKSSKKNFVFILEVEFLVSFSPKLSSKIIYNSTKMIHVALQQGMFDTIINLTQVIASCKTDQLRFSSKLLYSEATLLLAETVG